MRVALVHDYLNEFGGAERVLKELAIMFPKAPIYTAFKVSGSQSDKEFKGSDVRESFLAPILKMWKLYSPLRFLTPIVWKSFNLSKYDLVITSSSWYITRGFRVGKNTKVICYCHTPPRWLYGYAMSVGFTKYWPVRVYGAIVGHFMRLYDYKSAQTVDHWIANSQNVKARIKKFYRKSATVIYPPVEVEKIIGITRNLKKQDLPAQAGYFLIVSRLVGAKGLEEAAIAANKLGIRLKIAGEGHGYSDVAKKLKAIAGKKVQLVGRVSDKELYKLYGHAKGFIALARDEDFGMTPVEAMAAGTPVIAFKGGGFVESIVDGVTGLFVDDTDIATLKKAFMRFDEITWDRRKLVLQARRFSKDRFRKEIKSFVNKHA